MFNEYIGALALIFIAEMGDKTQILSMAFATKYKIEKILMGVAIGSFINHGLAILLGTLLTQVIKIEMLTLIAGVMFIVFALWSLTVDDDDEDDVSITKYGPIVTVALAFFLGELGDKTQLTALTLASSSKYPYIILAGTVSGMVLTSMIGIFIGSKLGSKIPEMQLKLGAFAIFMLFGLQKLLVSPYIVGVDIIYIVLVSMIVFSLSLYRIRLFMITLKSVEKSRFVRRAEDLYQFTHKVDDMILKMCHGEESCVTCSGEKCLVGFLKATVKNSLKSDKMIENIDTDRFRKMLNKDFSKEHAIEILTIICEYYDKYPSEYTDNKAISMIRMSLEVIIYGEVQRVYKNYDDYREHVTK
ncbi:MAG: TMEM165/GDT1 family protein [Acidaminobacteraceae bacterium]